MTDEKKSDDTTPMTWDSFVECFIQAADGKIWRAGLNNNRFCVRAVDAQNADALHDAATVEDQAHA